MANIEAQVEQQQAEQEQPELQFIVAEEWPGECCAPPAAPPHNPAEQGDEQKWDAGRCVA